MATEIVTKVEFDVTDRLVVSDPCYIDKDDRAGNPDVEAALTTRGGAIGLVFGDCAGRWTAEFDRNHDGRVSALRAFRAIDGRPSAVVELIGTVCVDSGQMFIGCASAFGLDYEQLLDNYRPRNPDRAFDKDFFGFLEGAVSSTGYGDGEYPVYVRRDPLGRVAVVEVAFDEDGQEDGHEEG